MDYGIWKFQSLELQWSLEFYSFSEIGDITDGSEVTDRRGALTVRRPEAEERDLNGDYVGGTIPAG